MVGGLWNWDLPRTRERIDDYVNWLINVCQCDAQMTEKQIENLIKRKYNGKIPSIREPKENGKYYECDLPKVGNKRKKIKKTTRLEVLKEVYLFFYGTECQEKKKPTFEEAYKEWTEYRKTQRATPTEGGLSAGTICRQQSDYKTYLSSAPFCKRRIDKITTADLYEDLLVIIRREGLTKHALKNHFGYINQTFERAIDKGIITQNPMNRLDKAMLLRKCKEEKVYNDKERILNDIETYKLRKVLIEDETKNPQKPTNYAIELSLYTGLRVGELVALKYSDVVDGFLKVERSEHEDRLSGENYVYYLGDTKNNKHRRIPLNKDAQDVISRLRLATQGKDNDFLFRDEETGQRITTKRVQNAIIRRGNKAGVSKVSIHRIRRTFVSKLISKGIPINVVADWTGHLPEVSIENYMYNQWTEEQQRKSIAEVFNQDNVKESVI